MTLAAALITDAFRENNIIPVGTDPSSAQQAEGLDALNTLVLSAFGFFVGNKLRDWQVPTRQMTGQVSRDWPLLPGSSLPIIPPISLYPPPNSRVVWDGSAQHIYVPPTPQDGAILGVIKGSGANVTTPGTLTVDGNGRTIEGTNTQTFTDGTSLPRTWFYRADLGDWRKVVAMASGDECLFPPEFDDVWICALSMRMAPRYHKEVAAETKARMLQTQVQFRARYQQSAPTGSGGEQLPGSAQAFPVPSGYYGWMT